MIVIKNDKENKILSGFVYCDILDEKVSKDGYFGYVKQIINKKD